MVSEDDGSGGSRPKNRTGSEEREELRTGDCGLWTNFGDDADLENKKEE